MIRCPCGATQENEAGLQWVACDACNYWMHAYCVGIQTPTAFRALKTEKFICQKCKEEREKDADATVKRIIENERTRLRAYLKEVQMSKKA